jgi:predicted site-specific integrase-resolvase
MNPSTGEILPTKDKTKILLDDVQAAELLQMSPGTLSVWRSLGRYNLPFVKIGSKVRYRLSDLEAFLDRRTRTQTEGV